MNRKENLTHETNVGINRTTRESVLFSITLDQGGGAEMERHTYLPLSLTYCTDRKTQTILLKR